MIYFICLIIWQTLLCHIVEKYIINAVVMIMLSIHSYSPCNCLSLLFPLQPGHFQGHVFDIISAFQVCHPLLLLSFSMFFLVLLYLRLFGYGKKFKSFLLLQITDQNKEHD